jgi:branched-chain amino acid transport system substrate-binding protein
MVPGQHHVRMNMYIAQANNGNFKIVKSLGVVDPKEAVVPRLLEFASMSAAG